MKGILVIAELESGEISNLTKEMLSAGKKLSCKMENNLGAAVLGDVNNQHVETLAAHGADIVFVGNHEVLKHFNSEIYLRTLENLIRLEQPRLVLCAMSANGREIGSRLAARLGSAFLPGCMAVNINQDGKIEAVRLGFGGSRLDLVTINNSQTVILGIPPEINGIEEPIYSAVPNKVEIDLVLPPRLNINHIDTLISDPGDIDLTEADVIIAGGNGMGNKETFALLQEAADIIGAPVGGSRVALDKGWIPAERMIGATGKVIRAKVYLAWGIAGAIQHTIGITGCEKVIAVNKNSRAEIMQTADLAVVGDVREILPELVNQLREYTSKT